MSVPSSPSHHHRVTPQSRPVAWHSISSWSISRGHVLGKSSKIDSWAVPTIWHTLLATIMRPSFIMSSRPAGLRWMGSLLSLLISPTPPRMRRQIILGRPSGSSSVINSPFSLFHSHPRVVLGGLFGSRVPHSCSIAPCACQILFLRCSGTSLQRFNVPFSFL